jgi:hypothetical protein
MQKEIHLPKDALVQYVKKPSGKLFAVLVAVKMPDDTISVDYAVCNLKKERFTKSRGLEIALGRATKSKHNTKRMPIKAIHPALKEFNERVKRYYRLESLETVVTWA